MSAILNILPFTREPTYLEKAWMIIRYPIDLVASPIKAIISIPTLSFLVIPAFSSYSTSINLFFFYMTWSVLLSTNDPIRIELFGTLGTRILFYVLPSFLFLAFDSATPDLAIRIKEHGGSALPTSENRGGGKAHWWKFALISSTNVMLSVAIQIGLEILITQVFHMRSLLRITTAIPFPWSIAKDLVLGLCLREILTYVLHRYVLHSEESPLSRMHESWQHNFQTPFSLVAHYDHPLPYLLHIFFPMYLPAILMRFHILTYYLYLILVSLEETFTYSGYNVLPSAFILGGIARRQETHFMNEGEGNFGCFGLADVLMGTSLGTDVVEDVIEEADQQHVGKKAKGKARSIGKLAGKKGDGGRRKSTKDNDDTVANAEYDDLDDVSGKDARVSRRKTERKDEEQEDQASGGESEDIPSTPARKSGRPRKASKRSNDVANAAKKEPTSNFRNQTREGSKAAKNKSRSGKRSGDDS